MKKVLLIEYIHPDARKLLEEHVQIIDDLSRIGEVDAIIDRNEIKVTEELLNKANNLKVVGVHGTGMDAVDQDACRKHGVIVFSTPGLNARSVAELNVSLALDLSRKITEANRAVRDGAATSHTASIFEGHEISGKTFGMIGMGNIAKITSRILIQGFGANVIAWSRSLTVEQAQKLGVGYCYNIEEVLSNADIIIMGLALTDETTHLIGESEFSLCKDKAIFINTARGKLVDEDALYHALCNGKLAGAASDVFVQEPVTNDNPLASLDHFVALPHLGANTEEALYRVGMAVVTGILYRLGIEY